MPVAAYVIRYSRGVNTEAAIGPATLGARSDGTTGCMVPTNRDG
jgi:hypothetical protein